MLSSKKKPRFRPIPVEASLGQLGKLLPSLSEASRNLLCDEFRVYTLTKPPTGVVVWKHMRAVKPMVVKPVVAKKHTSTSTPPPTPPPTPLLSPSMLARFDTPIRKRKASVNDRLPAGKRHYSGSAKKRRTSSSSSFLSIGSSPTSPVGKHVIDRLRKPAAQTTVLRPKIKREVVLVLERDTSKTPMIAADPDDPSVYDGPRVYPQKVTGWFHPSLGGAATARYDGNTDITRKAYKEVRELKELTTLLKTIKPKIGLTHPQIVAVTNHLLPITITPAAETWYTAAFKARIDSQEHETALDTTKLTIDLLAMVPCVPRLDILLALCDACVIQLDRSVVPTWRLYDPVVDTIPPAATEFLEPPIIICDDIYKCNGPASAWIIAKRFVFIHRGKAYLSVNRIYDGDTNKSGPLVTIVSKYLQHLLLKSGVGQRIDMLQKRHRVNPNALGQQDTILHNMVLESRADHTRELVKANANYANTPRCIQAPIKADIALLNRHRFQMAAIVVHTARIWGVSYKMLANPIVAAMKASKLVANRDRIIEFANALDSYAKNTVQQPDTRPCKTRYGPRRSAQEIVCPFRVGRTDHIAACLATRKIEDGVVIDRDTMTVHDVWTKTVAKE